MQVYLIDRQPMRYDLDIFQFFFNLMEIMYLVRECMNMSSWWLKLATRINNNSERNWTDNNMLLNHFIIMTIVGHLYSIMSIDFHEHDMIGMMFFSPFSLEYVSHDLGLIFFTWIFDKGCYRTLLLGGTPSTMFNDTYNQQDH